MLGGEDRTSRLHSVIGSQDRPSRPHSVIGREDIPSPPQTIIGSKVHRDNALMRIPRAQRYLTPPRTKLELDRAQPLPPIPNNPIRSHRSISMHSMGELELHQ